MYMEWLIRKLRVDEIEKEQLMRLINKHERPFGASLPTEPDKEKMEDGDEIWEFSSSTESWSNMCGCGGISLVRNGEVFNSIILMRN